MNLRANSSKGRVNYGTEWGYLYNNDCEICKSKNECTVPCKHRTVCKLYIIKTEEGIVRVKRLCKNAKLPVRGIVGAAGYDPNATKATIVPAHGKVLVKTGYPWPYLLAFMVGLPRDLD